VNTFQFRDFLTQFGYTRFQLGHFRVGRHGHTADAIVLGLQAAAAVALFGDVTAEQFAGLRIDGRVVEEAGEGIFPFFIAATACRRVIFSVLVIDDSRTRGVRRNPEYLIGIFRPRGPVRTCAW
jgi:hypothetical protein